MTELPDPSRSVSARKEAVAPPPQLLDPGTPAALGEADDGLFRHSAELGNHIPWSADPYGRIINVGARFRDLTGEGPGNNNGNIGHDVLDAIHPLDMERVYPRWSEAIATGEPFEGEMRLRAKDGSFRWYRVRAAPQRGPRREVERWYGVAEDIDAYKAAEAALAWTASHDALTRLLNRTAFLRDVAVLVDGAEGSGRRFVLVVVDIDQFADVNAQYGPEIGDRLLQLLADRLRIQCQPEDLIARLDGDTFAALMRVECADDQLDAAAEDLMTALAAPIPIGRNGASARASVGGVVFRGAGGNVHDLMRSATHAMREAKQQVHRRIHLFESGMRASLQRRSSMMAVARQALRQKLIVPYYQPKISFAGRSVAGFEALLRIRGLKPGVLGPQFITAAFQDNQLAVAITDRMLDLAIRDMAKWRAMDVPFGSIAVNVSQGDMRAGDFRDRLLRRLDKARLPHDCIEVEVPETVLLDQDADGVEEALHSLSAAGIRIALDDFGTGFASLTHLQRFPVDVIKIDQRFVRNLVDGQDDAAIVRAIVDLSRNLSITTVAEGVENRAQARVLADMGCDLLQGHLLAEGMPAGAVAAYLEPASLAAVTARL